MRNNEQITVNNTPNNLYNDASSIQSNPEALSNFQIPPPSQNQLFDGF